MTNEPRLAHRDAFLVVGMQITTNPMDGDIPALWQRFVPRIGEVSAVAEPRVSYGVMGHFDHAAGTLDYMAGVCVSHLNQIPEGMVGAEIPPNTYAVFEATLPALSEVFGHIYNTWLPASNYEHVAAPYFERYGESFDPSDTKSVIEIFIPVKTRGQ